MPWQIGSKISVSPRSGISSPNGQARRRAAAPDERAGPGAPLDQPGLCRSRIARPTVMRDAPNVCPSSASLGSRAPVRQPPGLDIAPDSGVDLPVLRLTVVVIDVNDISTLLDADTIGEQLSHFSA